MALNLPEKDFLTAAELAERWGKNEGYVMHLIGVGKLPVADRHAAHNGKRRTFFLFPDAPVSRRGPHPCATHPTKAPPPTDDDLIVSVEGVWDDSHEVLRSVSMSYGACGLVVLLRDVVAFETAHTAPEAAGTPDLKGPLLDAARQAAAAFPSRYPEFNSRPPKVKDDVIPWLQEAQFAGSKNDAEKIARILAEHFSLPGATRNT